MCEFLRSVQLLTKQKGLDPKLVFCPLDKRALCTETSCVLVEINETAPSDGTDRVDNFCRKAEKSLTLMRSRRHG
jgi:hypothetical protein